MAYFSYTARTRSGEKVAGTIEANDRRGALVEIERLGHVPVAVREGTGAPAAGKEKKAKRRFKLERRKGRKTRLRMREVLFLTTELSDLLASGMTLGNALHTLSRRKVNRDEDAIVSDLRDEIVQGTSLSDALAKRPESFSALYVSMVRAGEASGQLAEVLERLCRHYERVQAAREQVLTALIYPCIVLVMGMGTMVFAMVFVIPKFSAIFDELGSSLPLPTQIMIGMSTVLIDYGWLIAIVIAATVILLKRWVKTDKGRRQWHGMQLRIPVLKNITTSNAFGQFARTLGALLANGVPVLQALTIVEDTVGNVVIAEEIRSARDRVTDGATISGPLAEGNVFPPMLTDMLAVGEESGDMSGSLAHIAKRYDSELDRSVKVFTTVLEPILILVMAVLVGFVAVSMLLAVFDLTSGLNV